MNSKTVREKQQERAGRSREGQRGAGKSREEQGGGAGKSSNIGEDQGRWRGRVGIA